jgi:hypothetical protein
VRVEGTVVDLWRLIGTVVHAEGPTPFRVERETPVPSDEPIERYFGEHTLTVVSHSNRVGGEQRGRLERGSAHPLVLAPPPPDAGPEVAAMITYPYSAGEARTDPVFFLRGGTMRFRGTGRVGPPCCTLDVGERPWRLRAVDSASRAFWSLEGDVAPGATP